VNKRKNPTEYLKGRGGDLFSSSWDIFFFPLLIFQLISHIEEMLQTAYNKFHTWQSRRMLKKT